MTPPTVVHQGNHLVCSSDRLIVALDTTTGAITRIESVASGIIFANGGQSIPWRLIQQGTTLSTWANAASAPDLHLAEIVPAEFTWDLDATGVSLKWTTSHEGVHVTVRLTFNDDGDLMFWPHVHVSESVSPPAHFVYPVLHPNPLGSDDRLLFPAHSGWLVSDPLATVTEAPYPDGYHGCSVQMMAYYSPAAGGLSLACHDPHVTHKQLMFGPEEWSVRHDAWDLRRGTDLHLDYPVVVSLLERGDWYEAAEIYRKWALTAPWSSAGENLGRVGIDRPKWLFEEIGLSIWGTPSSLDWSDRYRYLAEATNSTLHIVSGWDWPRTRPHYVGKEGWFPANFHKANLQAWADHYVTPYLNDLFISVQAPDFLENWEPNLVFPYKTFAFTVFAERSPAYIDKRSSPGDPKVMSDIDFFVCPSTEIQRDFHAWRDSRLVGDHDLAGVFYDISSGNPFAARCLRDEHGHTPGWSRDVLRAYAENNRISRAAMTDATGRIPAQGVETIVEHVIQDIDFYVSRAGAGPLGGLEALTLGPELPPGTGRDLVPLFQAIYHDVGPVHEDGWLTLDETFGDLFYWVVGRIALLWGGVFSMHYANNPPELIPTSDTSAVISWDGGLHTFDDLRPVEPGHLDFVRIVSALRTGEGNKYLAYGRMIPPPEIDSPSISLDYQRKNPVVTGVTRSGAWDVPQILSSAWMAKDGTIGVFLLNLGETVTQLTSTTHPAGWGVRDGVVETASGIGTATFTNGALAIDVSLPPRHPVTLVITPPE